MVSLTLRLDGSFGGTRVPTTSVGQEDCPSESLTFFFRGCLWTRQYEDVTAFNLTDRPTTPLKEDQGYLYLYGVRSSKSQSVRNICRLRDVKKTRGGEKIVSELQEKDVCRFNSIKRGWVSPDSRSSLKHIYFTLKVQVCEQGAM